MEELTEENIENICDDLKNSLRDLLNNGPNDDDEARVHYHLSQIEDDIFPTLSDPR